MSRKTNKNKDWSTRMVRNQKWDCGKQEAMKRYNWLFYAFENRKTQKKKSYETISMGIISYHSKFIKRSILLCIACFMYLYYIIFSKNKFFTFLSKCTYKNVTYVFHKIKGKFGIIQNHGDNIFCQFVLSICAWWALSFGLAAGSSIIDISPASLH